MRVRHTPIPAWLIPAEQQWLTEPDTDWHRRATIGKRTMQEQEVNLFALQPKRVASSAF